MPEEISKLDEVMVFYPWPHDVNDRRGLMPEGRYSRLAWLPTVGPTSWLLWGSIASELHDAGVVRVSRCDLARSLGLSPFAHRHGPGLVGPLRRLCRFGLFARSGSAYRVRLFAPRVDRSALERLLPEAQRLDADLFGDRLGRAE